MSHCPYLTFIWWIYCDDIPKAPPREHELTWLPFMCMQCLLYVSSISNVSNCYTQSASGVFCPCPLAHIHPGEHHTEVESLCAFLVVIAPCHRHLTMHDTRDKAAISSVKSVGALESWKAATWRSLHTATQHFCLHIVLHNNSKSILAMWQGLFSAWMPRSLSLFIVSGWCPGIKDTYHLKRQNCLQWKYFALTGTHRQL